MVYRDLLDLAMKKTGNSQASIADEMGWFRQAYGVKLKNDSMTASEFIKIMNFMGFDIYIKSETEGKDDFGVIKADSLSNARANELIHFFEENGYTFQAISRKTGDVLSESQKEFRRARRMYNGVVYDTKKSVLIADDFREGDSPYNSDGTATALYKDMEGRYFFVDYHNNKDDMIYTETVAVVNDFITTHSRNASETS